MCFISYGSYDMELKIQDEMLPESGVSYSSLTKFRLRDEGMSYSVKISPA